MALRHLSPATVKPPFGRYEHAVEVVGAGRLLFVSGQLGIRLDGSVPEGVAAQTEQALANVLAVLAEAGADQSNVVRMAIYMVDGQSVDEGYAASMKVWGPHPTAVTVQKVADLGSPGALVEIEVVAALE